MTILQSLGIKEAPGKVFSSLAAINKASDKRNENNRLADSLKRSAFLQQMLASSDVPEAISKFANEG
jgi:hypothetical protein